VVAGTETGVELADALAARVVPNTANVPELAVARRHKWHMAEAVTAAGLPGLAQICTDDPEEVETWISRERLAGRDLVIKPPMSASTDGVTRVPEGRGWREAFAAQLGKVNQWGRVNDRMLVQEYATGTEYVVDTFTYEGKHTVTDVCRYRKIHNGTYMAVYESMEWLAPDDPGVPEVIAYTRGVLDAVGLKFGAAHVEVMRTEDGPRLIELNARPHGAGHPRFCRIATGDSQVDRTVRYFAGLGGIPDGYTLLQHTLIVFLISRSAGVVRNAETLDLVELLPSHQFSAIRVKTGERLEVTKDLLGTLGLGFVVLAHEDREQVMADYAAVRGLEAGLVIESDELSEGARRAA
jgi:biotin carboxylase